MINVLWVNFRYVRGFADFAGITLGQFGGQAQSRRFVFRPMQQNNTVHFFFCRLLFISDNTFKNGPQLFVLKTEIRLQRTNWGYAAAPRKLKKGITVCRYVKTERLTYFIQS